MKKNNKIAITVLVALVAGILLALPIGILLDRQAMASSDITNEAVLGETFSDTAGDDYIFVVLDEVKVPLAAVPTKTSYSGYVVIAVAISLLFVGMLSYTYWYVMVSKNISHFAQLITRSELSSLIPKRAFFHPKKLAFAEHEVEALAAKHFI